MGSLLTVNGVWTFNYVYLQSQIFHQLKFSLRLLIQWPMLITFENTTLAYVLVLGFCYKITLMRNLFFKYWLYKMLSIKHDLLTIIDYTYTMKQTIIQTDQVKEVKFVNFNLSVFDIYVVRNATMTYRAFTNPGSWYFVLRFRVLWRNIRIKMGF